VREVENLPLRTLWLMLNAGVRHAVAKLGVPVDAAARTGVLPAVVTLIYHRVGRRSPSPVDISVATWQEQLDQLSASGRVIRLDDALAELTTESPARSDGPALVITVDDGTADWPDELLAGLVERNLPATFYVATDFVEGQRAFPDQGAPVSWSGLRDMLSTGLVTIGSHTHTHRVLAGLTATQAQEELDRAVELIEDRLGVTPHHFAYPKAVAPSPAAEVTVRRRHTSAVLAGNRVARPGTDLHRIGRHALTVADDPASFARKMSGGMLLEGWLRERRDAWQVSRSASS
jgi:peptidoglycan/xylan/chitin deacetylase (PgdA/CDA1 family)